MKNHLDTFTIHAFRGLKELTLDGLGKVNILVGDNNSGKTSVLEAIYLYTNPGNVGYIYTLSAKRGLGIPSRIVEFTDWLFPADHIINDSIRFSGKSEATEGQYRVVRKSISRIPENEYSFRDVTGTGLERGIQLAMEYIDSQGSGLCPVIEIWNNEKFMTWEVGALGDTPITLVAPDEYRFSRNLSGLYSEIYKMGLKDDLVELLRIFDPQISDLTLLERGEHAEIYIEHEKIRVAPTTVFGDGLRRILFIAMRLVSVRGGICLLDEFDNAIHHSALGATAKWLVNAAKKLDVQLFLTTHNLEALDALLAASQDEMLAKDDLVAYRLKEGGQLGKRISGAKLHSIRYEYGYDVR